MPNWSGSVANGLTYKAWDQTTGMAGATADASVGGGSTASAARARPRRSPWSTANTAPTLTGANNLTAIDEDATGNGGTLVSALIAGQVCRRRPGRAERHRGHRRRQQQRQLAVLARRRRQLDRLRHAERASARLLAADASDFRALRSRLRTSTARSAAGITFKAWDRSSGIAGSTADTDRRAATCATTSSNVAYGNNDGSATWNGNWVESDSMGSSPAGGNIRITGGALEIRPNNVQYISRRVDLSGASSATLSFTFDNMLGAGDVVQIQASRDGGASWTTLPGGSFDIGTNTGSGSKSYDISSFISPDAAIRIYQPGAGAKIRLTLDNIDITYTASGGGSTSFSSASASSGIVVKPINDAPVRSAGSPAAIVVAEDSSNATATPLGLSALAYGPGGGADEAGQTLVYKVTAIPAAITLWLADGTTPVANNSVLTLAQLRGLTYKTLADANGSGSVAWTVQDNGGTASGGVDTLSESLSVTITPVNDAPSISNGAMVALPTTDEDNTSSATQVATILIGAGSADADLGAARGIAITARSGAGSWQYSTDGSSWTVFSAVTASNALLLDSTSLVRYVPDGMNAEIATFSFRAWDQTSAAASANGAPQTANPGAGGGSSAYSSQVAGASLAVSAINDAPTLGTTGGSASYVENAAPVVIDAGIAAADVDDVTFNRATVSISGNFASGQDMLGFVDQNGITGMYDSASGVLTLTGIASKANYQTALASVSYINTSDAPGTSIRTISFVVRDIGNLDSAVATRTLNVSAVNDAPTLGNGTLPAVAEDSVNPAGQTVAAMFAGQFADPDSGSSLSGIAIVGNSANAVTQGRWQYSSNGGGNWFAIGAVADGTTALALGNSTLIRFLPVADYNGTPPALLLRGLDDTYVGGFSTTAASETRVTTNSTSNGGTTAIAAATASLSTSVSAVNDAPTLGNGTLAAVNEDTANPTGQSVATIFSGQFADIDAGASFSGVAVVGNGANALTQGAWQYSTNGGANWFAVASVGDGAGALALDSATRLRFVAVTNYHGTPSALVVRGLDNSYTGGWSTTAGGESRVSIDTTIRGGSSAIAAATASLATAINPVADTPSVTNATSAADTQTSSGLVISRNLADGAEVSHFKITAISNGTLYKNDGVTLIADGSFITFAEGNAGLKFTPTTGFSGSGGFTVRASVSNLDAGLGGAAVNATIAVNTAPTIIDGAIVALPATDENTLSPATTVDTLLAGAGWADADSGALKGIAITAVGGAGSWQYSTNGSTWAAVGIVSPSSALLLDATSRLRFQPDTLNGGPASLNFRAWDRTTGTASTPTVRSLANPGSGAGPSSYSSQSASAAMTVAPINDAPTLTDRALQFDGTDLVVVANHPSLVMTNTMTIEATIQRNGVLGANQIIVNKEGEYEVGISATGQLQWAFANSTPGWTFVNTSFTVPVDTWVRLAVSYNAGTVKVYVDGVQVDSNEWQRPDRRCAPGAQRSDDRRPTEFRRAAFRGLDRRSAGLECRAQWRRNRRRLRHGKLAGNEAGLVGYWRFSETAGTTAFDSSPQGNHGLLGNGVAANLPARTANLDYNLNEDGSLTVAAPGLLAKATDPEGSALTAVLVSGPANASSFVFNPDGSFSYAPTADFNGVDSFVFSVSDGSLASQAATVYLNVASVNDAPTLASGSLAAIAEDVVDPAGTALSTIFSGLFADVDAGAGLGGVAVVGNGADPATQGSWQYSTNGGGNWFAIGAVADGVSALALDSATLVRFVPVTDFNGSPAALLVRGLDNAYAGVWSSTAGGETRAAIDTSSNGGSTAIAATTATLSTRVSAIADTPTVSNATTNEDTQSTSGLVISRHAADGAEVSHFKITGISNGTLYKNDGTTVIASGSFISFAEGNAGLKFTPTADFNGIGSFAVQASTSNADAGLGGAAVLATITVDAVNDAPLLTTRGGALAYTENQSALAIDPALTITDIDNADLTSASVRIVGGLQSAQDVLGFVDQAGISGSYNAATGILSLSGPASLAAWQAALQSVTYYNSSDDPSTIDRLIDFQVSDGMSSASATRTITVAAVNDAPTLSSSYSLGSIAEDNFNSGGTLVSAMVASGVSDADSAALRGIAVVAVDNSNGSWQYTLDGSNWLAIGNVSASTARLLPADATTRLRFVPDPDFNGPVTPFSYKAWDLTSGIAGGISDASVTGGSTAFSNGTSSTRLIVDPVNDAPTTAPVTLMPIVEDSGARLITQAELLSNASDIDGPSLAASGLTISSGGGSLIDNGDGSWTYQPALNDDSAVSFSYIVTDGSLSAAGSATLDIKPVNDAPTHQCRHAGPDRRGQRSAADHTSRVAGQCGRCRRTRPDRNQSGHQQRRGLARRQRRWKLDLRAGAR